MVKTLDMKLMRYINLFARTSKVAPNHCFIYNNMIVFVVPKMKVQQAIGKDSENLRKMSEKVGKKIKVVGFPNSIADAEQFISTIINPAEFKSVEVDGGFLIINAGHPNKGLLIGRGRSRFDEMKKIVKEYFGKELKIL